MARKVARAAVTVGQMDWVSAIRIHHKDVIGAVAVGNEGEICLVGWMGRRTTLAPQQRRQLAGLSLPERIEWLVLAGLQQLFRGRLGSLPHSAWGGPLRRGPRPGAVDGR